MSTVPHKGEYTERDFLRDGLHALWVKIRHEKALYWQPYYGPKVYTFRWWKNAQAMEDHKERLRRERG